MLTRAIGPLTNHAGGATGRMPASLVGQFVLGILLGAIWVPCTGPTLAAAITLAGRGESIGRASSVMIAFGLGAVGPVLLLAYGSRRVVLARGQALGTFSRIATPVMGAALLVIGVLTATGIDKRIETMMVDHMPDWLLTITTRF
jgi:cytochrome c-type biogenesis protein